MIKTLICVLIFAAMSFPQIKTPLEKNNYTKLTTYDELTEFIYQLDESSDKLSVEIMGKTTEQRNLYALYFSNSQFGKDKSKIKVLIFAQQHGNEQSGKEGALLLASELLKPEYNYLLDKIDFVLVPQMNPDGSEKNQRRNGNGMDLNRNHLILTEPETIALHKLFDKYLFDVTMDVHEYWPFGEEWKKLGFRRNFDETIGAMTNINISEELRRISYDEYLPFVFKYISDKGFSVFHYLPGGPVGIDYLRYSTFDINDGRQSFGIQNTLSFIQEGMNGENYSTDKLEQRAKGQMTGMFGLLEFSYQNADIIKELIYEEREKLINNEVVNDVAIKLDHFSDGTELQLPLLSYNSNKDTIVTVKDFRSAVKSLLDVERPEGYLIPKEIPELKIWADNHNIKYDEAKTGSCEKVEEYFIEEIEKIDFERDTIFNPIVKIIEISESIDFSKYYFIPVNQIKNNMIVIALEPKSMLGLVTYKKYEHLLKAGEIYPILRVVN